MDTKTQTALALDETTARLIQNLTNPRFQALLQGLIVLNHKSKEENPKIGYSEVQSLVIEIGSLNIRLSDLRDTLQETANR